MIIYRNQYFGFVLMAKGATIEFSHPSQEVIKMWVRALQTSIILTDLKEDFIIGQLIGKGNFAKVHVCERKADEATFALKSIDKNLILKNPTNQVSAIS